MAKTKPSCTVPDLDSLINADLTLTPEALRLLKLAQLQQALLGNDALLRHLGTNELNQTVGTSTVKVQALPYEDLTRAELIARLRIVAPELLSRDEPDDT